MRLFDLHSSNSANCSSSRFECLDTPTENGCAHQLEGKLKTFFLFPSSFESDVWLLYAYEVNYPTKQSKSGKDMLRKSEKGLLKDDLIRKWVLPQAMQCVKCRTVCELPMVKSCLLKFFGQGKFISSRQLEERS